jgi:hypothetical protein
MSDGKETLLSGRRAKGHRIGRPILCLGRPIYYYKEEEKQLAPEASEITWVLCSLCLGNNLGTYVHNSLNIYSTQITYFMAG